MYSKKKKKKKKKEVRKQDQKFIWRREQRS